MLISKNVEEVVKMESNINRKILSVLENDVLCEAKNIDCPIDPQTVLHNHDGYELLLFLDGDLNFYTERTGKRLEHGDLICIPPYEFHHGELLSHNVYDRIVINIKEPVMKKLSTKQTDLSSCFFCTSSMINLIHLNETEISQYTSYALQLQDALVYRHFGDDVLIDAILKQILVMINRHAATNYIPSTRKIMPDLVANIFTYIEQHLGEELTLQEIAKNLHMNSTYMGRCFKKTTGASIQQYIIAKKITLAQQYLRQGHAPCDVCYMTGFNNYSNFSRTFSKQAGCSPKQYQLKNKEG